jgi:hypothetical protein
MPRWAIAAVPKHKRIAKKVNDFKFIKKSVCDMMPQRLHAIAPHKDFTALQKVYTA